MSARNSFRSVSAWAALLLLLDCGRPQLAMAQDAKLPQKTAPQDRAILDKPAVDARPISFETESYVRVRPDRTSQTTHTVRLRINQESALATAGQATLPYTDGMETLTVTEAYTLKPDGSRLAVDPATILTRDAASGLNAVYLKDAKTKTLLFPGIAVGDTLVYTTIRDIQQTSFDGQFSYGWLFNRAQPWRAAKHTIEAPADLRLQLTLRGDGTPNELTHSREELGDLTRHTIVFYPGEVLVKDEAGAVAPSDREPGFNVTTFPDFKALGEAYWRQARPKAVVTPEIEALANEVTRGQDSVRGKVDALDRWIKRNVRYVAVYLGRERWIPNAASAVLVNKYGDCKDNAVLLTALLQAVGITSEHALINLGAAYSLPEQPPGPFNHVIVYIPELTLYLDPTASLAALSVLSHETYDKPVVHASDAGVRLARTPPMRPADHQTVARTVATVAADGTIEGVTTQTATGIFATSARVAYLRFQGQGFQPAAEARLTSLGTSGSGAFESTSPSELREPYAVKGTFRLAEKLALPLVGNRRLPVGLPVHGRPSGFLLGTRLASRKHPFVCLAGTQIEELALTFADGLPLPRIPQTLSVDTKTVKFSATYALEGRTFTAKRTFISRVTGQVCQPSLETELERPMKAIRESLGSVLVFGRAQPTSGKKP